MEQQQATDDDARLPEHDTRQVFRVSVNSVSSHTRFWR